jgi:hypothetical protein
MRYYSKIMSGKLVKTIVAEPEFFDNFVDKSPGEWIEVTTTTPSGLVIGGAGFGFNYNEETQTFIAPETGEVEE